MPIDPKLQRCKCGYGFHPTLLMKLVMLFRGTYIYTCPVCQARLSFRLVYHVVKIGSEEVDKSELYKQS